MADNKNIEFEYNDNIIAIKIPGCNAKNYWKNLIVAIAFLIGGIIIYLIAFIWFVSIMLLFWLFGAILIIFSILIFSGIFSVSQMIIVINRNTNQLIISKNYAAIRKKRTDIFPINKIDKFDLTIEYDRLITGIKVLIHDGKVLSLCSLRVGRSALEIIKIYEKLIQFMQTVAWEAISEEELTFFKMNASTYDKGNIRLLNLPKLAVKI